MASVSFKELSKRYGTVEALRSVSLTVNEGELVGLIGPDGAGKTTLMRILASLLLPDSGEARVAGFDVRGEYKEVRKRIGYMPGRFSLYPDLTVEESVTFFASLYGTSPAEGYSLVSDIYEQLAPFANRRAGKLSGGMKQKLALCCALIHRPEVLLLDEPTTGIDAVSRAELWDMLDRVRGEGITILVSTPYMDEASRCDRIALMDHGRILLCDTPEAVAAGYPVALWAIRSVQMHRLLDDVRRYALCRTAFSFGRDIHATFAEGFVAEDLRSYLKERGHTEVQILRATPSVEDRFIQIGEAAGAQ